MEINTEAKAMYREMLVDKWNDMNTLISKVESKVGESKDTEKAWKSLDTLMTALMKACGIKKDEIVAEDDEEEGVEEAPVEDEVKE